MGDVFSSQVIVNVLTLIGGFIAAVSSFFVGREAARRAREAEERKREQQKEDRLDQRDAVYIKRLEDRVAMLERRDEERHAELIRLRGNYETISGVELQRRIENDILKGRVKFLEEDNANLRKEITAVRKQLEGRQ